MQKYLLLLFTLLSLFSIVHAAEKDTCVLRIEEYKSDRKKAVEYDLAAANAWMYGNYNKALIYTEKGLAISKRKGLKDVQASLLNNRGVAYDYLGDYAKSLKCYFDALRIQETLDDTDMEANILSNIGLIYSNQGLLDKALKYHNEALIINRQNKDLLGVSANLNNIAILYVAQKKFDKAIANYEECIRIDKELNDERGLGDDYNNIGICYLDMKEYDKAMEYLQQALTFRLKTGDRLGISETYTNIASTYQNQWKWEKAKEYYLLSLPISKELGSKESLRYTYENLIVVEEELNNVPAAYSYYKLYILYRDSLENIDQTRFQTELELSYQYDKEKERQRLIQEKRDERARIILYSVIAVAVLILVFFGLLYKRWKYTKLQQVIIEEKTALVQQKNDEILDSISYAKRIQTAILPSQEFVAEHLPNSFVIYTPKDIVAGDFYWLEEENHKLFFAVADCTGHGVPGAMMSVVCHNALNRALHEFRLLDSALLLDKTRSLIIDDLSKNSSKVADGMDISLCVIDKNKREIQWSGANSPLWIYRSEDKSIEVVKGDKQPIGIHRNMNAFSSSLVSLSPGDSIYLFTDGYVDQFGGERGRKLMARQFREWIIESAALDIHAQGTFLENRFMQWKGSNEQVDDVCVVGFKLD